MNFLWVRFLLWLFWPNYILPVVLLSMIILSLFLLHCLSVILLHVHFKFLFRSQPSICFFLFVQPCPPMCFLSVFSFSISYCLSFFSVSLSYFCLSFSFFCCLVVCPLSVCLSVFLLDVNDVGSTDFGRNALPPTRSWKRH